ncbi:MAG: bacillithiol biosynthesis cysteine-adding enzyme BshC [Bacteroidetes bacterium]|nr:bacillithiol biosynthesis cysteine-adding enzyme BshC [Bacteroidota bacterium]
MKTRKIDFSETHAFSSFFLDYIRQKEALQNFYHRFPSVSNFNEQISEKSSFSSAQREVLVNELKNQYSNLVVTEKVKGNIVSLGDSKTFTVTTGHQLNIFTGPLYFIYKIITVINACKELKAAYPQYHFVPVYWMASEDHDYEEIKYFRLYGKKYVWQTEQQGAVGRFHTKELKALLREIPGDISVFQEAYSKSKNLSEAVLHYVNALFGNEGLVVVDADNRNLKKALVPVIKDDLLQHSAKKSVDQATEKLHALGYHTQVNAREINFFYLMDGLRSRIEKTVQGYQVVDTDLKFSESEMIRMAETEPEKFSPNVVLRPLYQELILPNLAYCGGPAELVYWLQLKGVFENFHTPFPILLPRSFAMVIDQPTFKKFEKTKLEIKDLFEEKNYLFNHWIAKNSANELSLGKELESIQQILQQVKERASKIDSTLTKFVGAETQRTFSGLEKIEKKMLRAEKRLHIEKLQQIEAVKDALFPNGSLQERTDNFLNFHQSDPAFISKVAGQLAPFDFSFNVLIYD